MVRAVPDDRAGDRGDSGRGYGCEDLDAQPELARQYKVLSIPTLMVFKGGELAKRETGAKPKEEILQMLK